MCRAFSVDFFYFVFFFLFSFFLFLCARVALACLLFTLWRSLLKRKELKNQKHNDINSLKRVRTMVMYTVPVLPPFSIIFIIFHFLLVHFSIWPFYSDWNILLSNTTLLQHHISVYIWSDCKVGYTGDSVPSQHAN